MSKHRRPDTYTAIQAAIGTRIQWARELVEPNQSAFARLLGVDPSTLNKIETGERPASIFNILALSNRLRVSTDFLLKGLLTAQTDQEMALLLAAHHPELVLQLQSTAHHRDTEKADDTSGRPMRPSPGA